MMYSFLTRDAETMKVVDNLTILKEISARTEVIAAQILRNVGQAIDQLAVNFLQKMLVSRAVSDIRYIGVNPTPVDILKHETFQDCVASLYGTPFRIVDPENEDEANLAISTGGEISDDRLALSESDYYELRKYMLGELSKASIPLDEFYNYPFFKRDSENTGGTYPKHPPNRRKGSSATS